MGNVLLVALGGALGAVSRFLVGVAFARRLGVAWPYGTFAINLSGCFIIGLALPLLIDKPGLAQSVRYLLPIGFVGAYTTFSSYEYETLQLISAGAYRSAASYVLLSNVLGLVAVWAGVVVAKRI